MGRKYEELFKENQFFLTIFLIISDFLSELVILILLTNI